MSGKKCPNCGACQECGHAPNTNPWTQPYGPYYVPNTAAPTFYPAYGPYWSVSPYNGTTFTVTNTNGAVQ